MLNQSGIKKTTYGAPRQILANVELQHSVGIVVAQAVGVDVSGRKIAKAGTPVTGSLDARTTPFTAAVTAGEPAESNAVGVLLHDVDVTDGAANGTLLIFGFVNKSRLEADVLAKVTAPVATALNAKVTFINA